MVQHPRTPEELARLPLAHQRIARRQSLDDVPDGALSALDEQGNTVLHRLVALTSGEGQDGSHDARMLALLVNREVPTDVRNLDGQTALDIARERHASANEQDAGSAKAARLGSIGNVLNAQEAQPGIPIPSGATDQAMVDDPLLLRDQVYMDDLDGVRQSWAAMRSPSLNAPGESPKPWLFYEANSSEMMDLLGQELGLSPNNGPTAFSHVVRPGDAPERYNTPLQMAIQYGDDGRVQALLDHGADPNQRHSSNPDVPLEMAIKGRDEQSVRRLLDAGASFEWQQGYETALTMAIRHQCSAGTVEAFLAHGANPNAEVLSGDGRARSPLHFVTDRHDPAIIDALLDHGARQDVPNTAQFRNQDTPQFAAAARGDVGVALRIAERGGDPAGLDTLDRHGNTPLSRNLDDEHAQVAQRLMEHGAKASVTMATPAWRQTWTDNGGTDTAVMRSVVALEREQRSPDDHRPSVAHPSTPDELARLPEVHRFLVGGATLVPKDFMANLGDRINALDADGNTALHRAVMQSDDTLHRTTSRATWLMENGIATDVRNHAGQTALDLARERYAGLSETGDPAVKARVAIHANLLNEREVEPGPRLQVAVSKDTLVHAQGLLSDLVRSGDTEAVKAAWPNVEPAQQEAIERNTRSKGLNEEVRGLFFEARTPAMIDTLAKDCGLSPNQGCEIGGHVPLQRAVFDGEHDRVESLLANGAQPDMIPMLSNRDQRPLGLAIAARDERMVGMLCEHGARVSGLGNARPSLVQAVEAQCSPAIVRTLLNAGADPNERQSVDQFTKDETPCPLHLVTDRHDPAVTDLLLDYGARHDSTYQGLTSQFHAAYRGDVDVVHRLVQRGGDPAGVNTLDQHGNPPLAYRLNNNDLTMVNRLLDHGAVPQIAMQSPRWKQTDHAVGETPAMEHIQTWQANVLRVAAEQAQKEMAVERDQPAAEPPRARVRQRL